MYIGFNNGYYDLNTMEFKHYTPEIYITMTTGYDYVPSNNELRNELMNILNKIFPDPVLMDYVLLHLSSCLDGLNENELVHFYTGLNDNNGSNGKSLLCSIIHKCFGEYSINGHPSIITSSTENPESANSSIMVLNKKKIVIFQEIQNNGKKLNDIRLKRLSGNDPISGRELYNTQKEINPTFQMIICANELPNTTEDNEATRRRYRNVPFESTFKSEDRIE